MAPRPSPPPVLKRDVRVLARSGVVRAWNMDAGAEQALEGHAGGIYCLAQGGAYLFSGGDDTGVKTWQYANERFEPLTELKGHTSAIQVMKTVPGSLITADRGGTVAKWCLETGALQMTFNTAHTNHLMAMWLEETHLFTAALDGHVKVWDFEGNQQYDQVRVPARRRGRPCVRSLSALHAAHVDAQRRRARACCFACRCLRSGRS